MQDRTPQKNSEESHDGKSAKANNVMEDVIRGMFAKGEGKVLIHLERFSDALEVTVRKYSGAAPIYGGFIEQKQTIFDDIMRDDFSSKHVIDITSDFIRKLCLNEP